MDDSSSTEPLQGRDAVDASMLHACVKCSIVLAGQLAGR